MSRLVDRTRGAATTIAASVSGAPRATVAVALAVTLLLGSLLPQLALVNSEDMWLPEGARTDAYHTLSRTLGSTEYVGVLASASDGNIVSAADFKALLRLEDAAVSNSTVAEAFRFPRAPEGNALSVADLVAEADAVLSDRRGLFEPLAAALNATLASTVDGATAKAAVDEAASFVALLTAMRELDPSGRGRFEHRLLDVLLPDLEVALLSGTDEAYKADAASLLLAGADFANWSRVNAPLAPADPALTALRGLVLACSALLFSNASAPTKAAAIGLLSRALFEARDMLDLDAASAAAVRPLLEDASSMFDAAGDPAAIAAFSNTTASLARALLFVDRLSPVGDAEAASGVAAMAAGARAVLGAGASVQARAGAAALMARLFEAFIAMGDRGLDLNIPQTNISYDSYSVALNENATALGAASVPFAAKQSAAQNLSTTTSAFLGNLVNLNALGIFTDQASYDRIHTMVVFLNDSFAGLVAALALADDPGVLDHLASMASQEVLHVINTSAVPPHRFDANASRMLASSLRGLEAALLAQGASPGAAAFGRAAGWLFASTDVEAVGLLPSAEEDLLTLFAEGLESSRGVLEGGDPPASKALFVAVAGAFGGAPAAALAGALPAAAERQLLAIVQREALSVGAMLQVGQNPALFSRLARSTLTLIGDGLNAAAGALEGTDAALLAPVLGALSPLPQLLASASTSNATKDLVVAQAFAGASLAERHLTLTPPPKTPRDRVEAAARLDALGDAGVEATLGVLLGVVVGLPPLPPSVPAGDVRFQPFTSAVALYNPGVEQGLRDTLGFRARTLLPNALSASSSSITAKGTVVLFLFNGSLDRATLGAREAALRSLSSAHSTDAVTMTAFGYGLMWYDTQRAMDLSVVLFSLTMLAVMGAALWAVYRNLFDVLLTLALLGFTVVWVLGTAALVGIAINPVTQVIPVLLIGLAEDYAVHITVGYRRKRARGAAPGRAVAAAVLGIGGVLFVATITNGLSFLSFGGSNIELINDFGTLMALGLAYSFILTLTFIPAATVWHDRRVSARQKARSTMGGKPKVEPNGLARAPGPARRTGAKRRSGSERALLRIVRTCIRHPWTTLLVVALLTAASGLGASTLATTFSYDQITARDLEVVRTLNGVQDNYPAAIQRVFIVVDGRVDDPGVFLALDAAAGAARDDPYVVSVGGSAGVASISSHINDLASRIRLEGASASGYSAAFASAFEAADTNGDGRLSGADNLSQTSLAAVYSALLDDPAQTASEFIHRGSGGFDRAAVRVEVLHAVEHGDELTAALEVDAAPLRAAPLSASVNAVTVTGLPLLNREVMQAVQESGWQSVLATIILALGVLTVFFYAAFRSLALGPLTIAPTLIAVAWTLGAMVVVGLSLNMMTVMIATTTVGMGDLYAIHISYSFYRELRLRKSAARAAREMVYEAGAPLLEASATTALGFLILVLAPVPVVQSYGLIFAASIVFAFLYSIIVMPVLVLLLARATHQVGRDAPP